MLVVGLGAFVGFAPAPSPLAQMTALLVMTGLVAASLWLRRRDHRAYQRRLAQETAARAVAEDRLVIARGLHDAVSGDLGAITVRCAVALRLETTPDGLRSALSDVETASREATDGLRRMLAVLREESTPPAPGTVTATATGPPAPEPGSAGSITEDLREAIDRARRADVTVEVDADTGADAQTEAAPGEASLEGLPVPVTRAATRVVAEALANTVRHAGPTHARVRLGREPGRLRIVVVDDGPAADWEPRSGTGQGLRGLHERLTGLGGTLTAGPRTDTTGFAVEATLPVPTAHGGRVAGGTARPDQVRGRGGSPRRGVTGLRSPTRREAP